MKIVNLTPHQVRLNSGAEFAPSGTVARVRAEYTGPDEDGIYVVTFGQVQNLPAPEPGTLYVVSAMVAQAAKRADVVSPATGHPEAIRDASGQIKSVPGWVRA